MFALAHAGPGSQWQSVLVVAGIVLAVTVVLAAAGRVHVRRPGDLAAPLAAAAAAGTVGTLAHAWISDGIGWGLPLAVVSLLALVLAATTPLELGPFSPLTGGALALAIVATVTLHQPLTIALHPPPDLLPVATGSRVEIVEPDPGSTVPPGELDVAVRVHGGSIGPVHTPLDELGPDPEQAGSLAVHVDGRRVPAAWDTCSVPSPCDEVRFAVELLDPGSRRIVVEFTRGDGTPFAPLVSDDVTVEVAD